MFGDNPIRPPVAGDGHTLEVVQIFATIQGEGPFAGMPAIFIRLGGCNLACDFCDTEFETFTAMALDKIMQQVTELRDTQPLAVITGGEPLRQNIGPLCERLLGEGMKVQIETNGTLWRDVPEAVHVVCSPKISQGRYHPLREDVLNHADALKFIVSASHPDYGDIADVGQGTHPTPVYIQPMDEYDADKNKANQALAAKLAIRHNATLSLQLHKILGIE